MSGSKPEDRDAEHGSEFISVGQTSIRRSASAFANASCQGSSNSSSLARYAARTSSSVIPARRSWNSNAVASLSWSDMMITFKKRLQTLLLIVAEIQRINGSLLARLLPQRACNMLATALQRGLRARRSKPHSPPLDASIRSDAQRPTDLQPHPTTRAKFEFSGKRIRGVKWSETILKIILSFGPRTQPVYALLALAMILMTIIAIVALAGAGGTGLAVAAGVTGKKLASMIPGR